MAELALGIDLGGTKIAGALVTREGTVVAEVRTPTRPEEGVEPVIGRMAECIRALQAQAGSGHRIVGIGIGAAGSTDHVRGVVIMGSNLRWVNVPLRDRLLAHLGDAWAGPISVAKDTNAAALGELLYGAGRGAQTILYVTVGTGIGGGLVLEGKLYHGVSGGAADLGHLIVETDGPLCGCGKRGCVEALASGPAIARQAREQLAAGRPSILADRPPETLTAVDVVEAAQRGDALAREIITLAGQRLGMVLAWCVDVVNPERIIIGGGVAAAGDLLFEPVRQTVAVRALPSNVEAVRIVPAGLGANSGEIGAAALVWAGAA
ncbi:MAG: ROK family protein [Anaerolineae bacterium]|nr:ROK family protein [Anaerolineae bacterium]